MSIGRFLDTLHFIAIFSPILLYAIPPVYLKPLNPYMKWILLWFILIPLHWPFFNNQCIFTIITRKISKKRYTNTETSSAFSERNLKWLYKPVMDVIGWNWDSEGLAKMTYLHALINIILVWYYTFFLVKNN